MTQKRVIAATLGAMLAAPLAMAQTAPGDPAAGREKVRMCQGCHGIEGWRTAFPEVYSVPKIGGQHEAYLVKALQAWDRSAGSSRKTKSSRAGC